MAITGVFENTVDLDRGVRMTPMNQLFATADTRAHTVKVSVLSSGKEANLTGMGVYGYFIRADEETVVITGSVSGNVVTLALPASCYVTPGHFSLIIKVSSGDDRKAVFWGDGFVTRSSTDVIVDPGGIVPSLETLLARIAEIEAATEAAKAATSAANTATANANAATDAAKKATQEAKALTDRWDDVSLTYEVLPPSEDPWAAIEQTEHDTEFKFGLPTSNLAYSTFEVDDEMELIMTSPEGFSDIGFELTDEGDLEVIIQ